MLTFKSWWEHCRWTVSTVRFVIMSHWVFWYMVSWPLPHMSKFHRILCSLSPCCLHTCCRDRGVELVWGQALVRMGSGGTKGALSHISFAFFGCSRQKFRHCPAYNHLNSSLLKCFTFIWFYQTGWHAWNWYLFAPFCTFLQAVLKKLWSLSNIGRF